MKLDISVERGNNLHFNKFKDYCRVHLVLRAGCLVCSKLEINTAAASMESMHLLEYYISYDTFY